jgi:uncharacterized protein
MFENAEIAVDALPSAEALDWQGLSSRYVRRLQAQVLLSAALGVVAVLTLTVAPLDVDVPVGAAWALLAVGTVFGVAWPPISIPRKGYAIRERDLVYRSGVVWRSENAIPFNRVQHVETGSTPLDRAFGLATLHLYTAGGSGSDLRIHGLPADVAERLRLFVLEQAGVSVEG